MMNWLKKSEKLNADYLAKKDDIKKFRKVKRYLCGIN